MLKIINKIIRSLLSYAVKTQQHIHTVDVRNAYLNALIRHDIYMYQVNGYENLDKPNYVCKLIKSLYGLPESSSNFYELVSSSFKSINLIPSNIDSCVFKNNHLNTIVLIHVDDFMIISPTLKSMSQQKDTISKLFDIKDNSIISKFLGVEYAYHIENSQLFMKQECKIINLRKLVADMLPNATNIPLQPKIDLYSKSNKFDDITLYQKIIGSLNYISLCSRPDITIYINQLSKFLRSPNEFHFKSANKVVA